MKIEVVLIDSIDGDNLTSIKNYDENKNLFEINKFEAKKNNERDKNTSLNLRCFLICIFYLLHQMIAYVH